MMRHSFAPAVAAVACLVAVACSDRTANAQALDRYCSATNPERVLLVVDQSEWFDDTDRARLFEGVNKMYSQNHFPPGAQLLAFPINDRPGTLTPDLKLCVPTCETQSGDQDCDDPLVRRDRALYQRALSTLLTAYARPPTEQEKAARAAARAASAKESPNGLPKDGVGDRAQHSEIIRTLSNLSREYEGRNVTALYVFSDMLEYSDLNKSVSNLNPKTLVRTMRSRAAPGRAFATAKVRVFGTGKRIGQGWKEKEIEENERRNAVLEETSSTKKAQKSNDIDDVVLNANSFDKFREFWPEYFKEAKVADFEIKLTYE